MSEKKHDSFVDCDLSDSGEGIQSLPKVSNMVTPTKTKF